MTLQTKEAVCTAPPRSEPEPLARPLPLLDTYLAAQRPVRACRHKFAQLHENTTAPLQELYYRSG